MTRALSVTLPQPICKRAFGRNGRVGLATFPLDRERITLADFAQLLGRLAYVKHFWEAPIATLILASSGFAFLVANRSAKSSHDSSHQTFVF
jgi:hypothetical protein